MKHFRLMLPACGLLLALLGCSVLPGGGVASSLQATANAALTQAAVGLATAGAQGNALSATANAALTQVSATANATAADSATATPAAPPTAGSTPAASPTASGPKDIPLIDPHTVLSATDRQLTYSTTADVETVATFYQDQMPKLGWAPQVAPYITASLAKMDFMKGSSLATIAITIDPTTKQTLVVVQIG